MSYMALYRKWRPQTFEEVKGQDAIVRTLRNQILYNRIGHAYLFCGTRGTGKTSIAKLFAKAVNCEHPVNGSPCNECASCRAINEQNSLDVLEIDAASNNGVDNVRDIREQVQYSPVNGRYKVFIIDEVHMLSPSAFNALLKTLEEPPSYVIFILATTEKHKVPVTILSRCQKYDFKRISIDTIADHLADLMGKEHVEVEDKALRYIARAADGSMRDALSLLDQCISFYLGQKLTYENVLEVLGTVDTSVFSQLLRGTLEQDTGKVLKIIDDLILEGRELSQFLSDYLWYLRNLLILKDQEGVEDSMDLSRDTIATLKEETKMVETGTLLRQIRILSELSNEIRNATQKRVLLEVGFIKLCRPDMEVDNQSLLDRIRVLEDKLKKGTLVIGNQTPAGAGSGLPAGAAVNTSQETDQSVSKESAQSGRQILEQRFTTAQIADLEEIAGHWDEVTAELAEKSPAVYREMRLAGSPRIDRDNSILILLFPSGTQGDIAKKICSRPEPLRELSDIVAQKTGKQVTFECRSITGSADEHDPMVALKDIAQEKINFPITMEP
ncbi:MAG: DNA polymerase III subunit gamma/tau [Lachnospiraceae bacterium]|nr:DNA polymerase III subunit gamma/tau [Lachnospiraceae bacterium]